QLRSIDQRTNSLANAERECRARYADDGEIRSSATGDADVLAQWRSARPRAPREVLADDNDALRARQIARGEIATGDEVDANRLEESGAHDVLVDAHPFTECGALIRLVRVECDVGADSSLPERYVVGRADGDDARKRRGARLERVDECRRALR